jgi:uridine kinase
MKTFIIAIDGIAGSGKTALAKLLGEKLNAEIIHTDDFSNWENPFDWWKSLIEKVLKPIENGAKTLSYPRTTWYEGGERTPIKNQPVTEIMIIEGVGALRSEFRPYINFSIFTYVDNDESFKRGLRRDSGKYGETTDEQLKKLWLNWVKAEDIYLEHDKPKEHADITVDGTKPFEVDRIAEIILRRKNDG